MNTKSFWQGYMVGAVLFIFIAISFYFKFGLQPDISLSQLEVSDLNGKKVELSDYSGKPLVVNYWATWCVPCIKEFPYFEKVKQELREKVSFVMISDESLEKIVRFSSSKPYGFIYLKSNKKLSEYGIHTRPTTYFYNAHGKLIAKHTGNLNEKTLKELIAKIK